MVAGLCCRRTFHVVAWDDKSARCGERIHTYWSGLVGLGFDEHCEGEVMIDVSWDGRDVTVVLRDDVWQVFGGTLSLTRTQAQLLRLHLNELNAYQPLDNEPEDG